MSNPQTVLSFKKMLGSRFSALFVYVWTAIRSVMRGFGYIAAGWWSFYKGHALAALLALVALALVLAVVLRWAAPTSAFIVSPFEVPVEVAGRVSITGRSVASMLMDELKVIEKEVTVADPEAGALEEKSDQLQVHPQSLRIDLHAPSTVGIEVGGLSLDRVIAEWNRIRQHQQVITGDLVYGNERLALRARTSDRGPWRVELYPVHIKGVETAIHDLAIQLLLDYRPDLVGLAYIRRGQLQEGLGILKGWVAREGQNANAYFYLGVGYHYGKLFEEAEEAYQGALKRRPNFPEATDNLAALVAKNQATLAAASAAYEDLTGHVDYRFYYDLGLEFFRKKNYPEAAAAFEKTVDLKDDFAQAYNNIGYTYLMQRKREEAIKPLRKAVDLKSDFPQALSNLGYALYRTGQYEEAIKYMRKDIALRPNRGQSHYNLASALYDMGRKDDAQKSFAEAMRLDPSLPPPPKDGAGR